jgi:hypothetical protein
VFVFDFLAVIFAFLFIAMCIAIAKKALGR